MPRLSLNDGRASLGVETSSKTIATKRHLSIVSSRMILALKLMLTSYTSSNATLFSKIARWISICINNKFAHKKTERNSCEKCVSFSLKCHRNARQKPEALPKKQTCKQRIVISDCLAIIVEEQTP